MDDARKIHGRAEMAREKGEFLEALKYTDEALMKYQEEDDLRGMAEVVASRFLTLRHIFEKTGEKAFLILAKQTARAGVEIAEMSGESQALVMPLFNLAKAEEELGEIEEAIIDYQKAVGHMEKSAPVEHDRPAVLADMKVHLAVAQLTDGDDEAEERAREGIEQILQSEELAYNRDVWTSGGYMGLAKALKNKNEARAKEYLVLAKEIIDRNPELKLRAKQWDKLAEEF